MLRPGEIAFSRLFAYAVIIMVPVLTGATNDTIFTYTYRVFHHLYYS